MVIRAGETHLLLRNINISLTHAQSNLMAYNTTFNCYTKCAGSPNKLHNRRPDWHPVSWPWTSQMNVILNCKLRGSLKCLVIWYAIHKFLYNQALADVRSTYNLCRKSQTFRSPVNVQTYICDGKRYLGLLLSLLCYHIVSNPWLASCELSLRA